ncbi:MAG: carboxypeptidase regulatory-like domain-containing protein [Candidatus Manganitrophaceae bacterium]
MKSNPLLSSWIITIILVLSPSLADAAATGGVRGEIRIGSKPAGGAVVYLREVGPKPAPVPPIEKTIEQKELKFAPDFLVVPVGTTLVFENKDNEMHNIKSNSPGNRFDIGVHMPGDTKQVVITQPGKVILRCSIHHGMRGTVFVSPSAYFTTTNPQGEFELKAVPAGTYQLEIWHKRLTTEEMKQAAKPVRIDAEIVTAPIDIAAASPAGADLTELEDRNWAALVKEMGTTIDRAIGQWKEHKTRPATTSLMGVHARLYDGSGLRNAIVQFIGEARASEHERNFNTLIKQVQTQEPDPKTEAALRKEKELLLTHLKEDLKKLPQ